LLHASRASAVERFVGIEAALAEVLRLQVADVQESVAADAEIDKGRLDTGLDVDHAPFVDVADVDVLARSLDIQLFEDSILDDRNPALFRLRYVDQHFLLHFVAFWFGMVCSNRWPSRFGAGGSH
jgi:hypothetical protein